MTADQMLQWIASDWYRALLVAWATGSVIGSIVFWALGGEDDGAVAVITMGSAWPILLAVIALVLAGRAWRWIRRPRPWTCRCGWRNPAENEACGSCCPELAKKTRFSVGDQVWDRASSKPGKIAGLARAGGYGSPWCVSHRDGTCGNRTSGEIEPIACWLKDNPIEFKVGDRVWHRGEKAFGTVCQNFLTGTELPDEYLIDFRPGSASGRSHVVSLARDLEDATLLCPPEEVEPYDPSKDELVDVLTSSPGGDETLVFAVLRRDQAVRYWEVDQSRWTVWSDPASGRLKLVGGTIEIEWGDSQRPWALSHAPGWRVVSMEHTDSRVELAQEREEKLTVQARFVLQRSKRDAIVVWCGVDPGSLSLGKIDRAGPTFARELACAFVDAEPRDPATNDIWRFDPFGGDSKTKIDDWCEPDAELAEPIKPRGVAYGSRPDPMAAPATKQDVENLREAVRKLKAKNAQAMGHIKLLHDRLSKVEAASHEQGVLATPEELEIRKKKAELIDFIKRGHRGSFGFGCNGHGGQVFC